MTLMCSYAIHASGMLHMLQLQRGVIGFWQLEAPQPAAGPWATYGSVTCLLVGYSLSLLTSRLSNCTGAEPELGMRGNAEINL
jgi:hypothetical protein